jgi:hypothetical protein
MADSGVGIRDSGVGVIGTGFSVTYAGLPNLIVEAAPAERTSEATGVAAIMRAVFMAIGAQVVMIILATDTIHDSAAGTQYPTAKAFTTLFAYVAVCCSLCLIGAYAAVTSKSSSRDADRRAAQTPPAHGI